jgi:poly(A) polymerase
MGFFGGVAWAIVVARVCQMFPTATAAAIVAKFFRILHDWPWPQPVLLKKIDEGHLGFRVWNPKLYPQDKAHRMPVITPSYPSMCSTHNITQSTQIITTQEFGMAAEVADKILLGQESWTTLFKKGDFFHRYKHYLQVIASSTSADTQMKWGGLVESRLRQLVMKLELVENLEIAHPYMNGFENSTICVTETQKQRVHHGEFFHDDPAYNLESDTSDKIEPIEIWTTIFYVGLGPNEQKISKRW